MYKNVLKDSCDISLKIIKILFLIIKLPFSSVTPPFCQLYQFKSIKIVNCNQTINVKKVAKCTSENYLNKITFFLKIITKKIWIS